MYKVDWNISIGSLVANIALAVIQIGARKGFKVLLASNQELAERPAKQAG